METFTVFIVFKDGSDKYLSDVESWTYEADKGFINFNTVYAGRWFFDLDSIKYYHFSL